MTMARETICPAKGYVGSTKLDQITSLQLGIDGQVEQREIADLVAELQAHPDCPDVLQFERRLLAKADLLARRLSARSGFWLSGKPAAYQAFRSR